MTDKPIDLEERRRVRAARAEAKARAPGQEPRPSPSLQKVFDEVFGNIPRRTLEELCAMGAKPAKPKRRRPKSQGSA
jgi:hypothetical protein